MFIIPILVATEVKRGITMWEEMSVRQRALGWDVEGGIMKKKKDDVMQSGVRCLPFRPLWYILFIAVRISAIVICTDFYTYDGLDIRRGQRKIYPAAMNIYDGVKLSD